MPVVDGDDDRQTSSIIEPVEPRKQGMPLDGDPTNMFARLQEIGILHSG
jgi:hypothetical protein